MMAVGKKGKGMTLNKWRRATEWFMTALALVFLFRVFVGSSGEDAYPVV